MRTFYLDLCCLNRPFDDQHQPRVRLEAEAVLGLIQLARLGELGWIGSDVLDLESSRNPDADKRGKVEVLLSAATSTVTAGVRERERGRELQAASRFAAKAVLQNATDLVRRPGRGGRASRQDDNHRREPADGARETATCHGSAQSLLKLLASSVLPKSYQTFGAP